jgi:Protein of unknown function (DUF1348)
MSSRPPLPPFTPDTAIQKVCLAEDSWNTRDRKGSPWLTPSIRVGGTARSFSPDANSHLL